MSAAIRKRRLAKSTNTSLLDRAIITVRGERVMLDTDLAGIYSVATKALNQAVKRNRAAAGDTVLTPSPSTAPSWQPTSSTARKRCR